MVPARAGLTDRRSMTTTLYGISNCDTVRKARRWLDDRGLGYRFHDLRRDGVDASKVRAWVHARGWESVLNRRGTTWRQLPAAARECMDAERAVALALEHPTLIKRPVLEHAGEITIGFDEKTYAERFEGDRPG
jgi:arsenate reductase